MFQNWNVPKLNVPNWMFQKMFQIEWNKMFQIDQYPIPRLSELLAMLAGGKSSPPWIWRQHISKCAWNHQAASMSQSTPTEGYTFIHNYLLWWHLFQPCSKEQWMLSTGNPTRYLLHWWCTGALQKILVKLTRAGYTYHISDGLKLPSRSYNYKKGWFYPIELKLPRRW